MNTFFINKGVFLGEAGRENPFYSTVLTSPEFFRISWFSSTERNRFIKVIEFSEYEKLQKKFEILKKAIKEIENIENNEDFIIQLK